MSSYFKALDTNEGQVFVLTKTRWLFIFPMPHTSVTPRNGANLKSLGTLIKWTTNDSATLAKLHNAIIDLVQEVGISGLAEIANSARMTQQVWKNFGGDGSGLNEVANMAAQDGVSFPMSP